MSTRPLPTTRRLGVLAGACWTSTFTWTALAAAGSAALVARGRLVAGALVGALTVGGYGASSAGSRALTQRWAVARAHDECAANRAQAAVDALGRLDAELEDWMRGRTP